MKQNHLSFQDLHISESRFVVKKACAAFKNPLRSLRLICLRCTGSMVKLVIIEPLIGEWRFESDSYDCVAEIAT